MTFINNIREAFTAQVNVEERDRGDLVQTLILIASFAVAAMLVANWITTSIINKGADIAGCIQGVDTFAKSGTSSENCKAQKLSDTKSFKNDTDYKGRFG